jgi:hypothetical protein
MMCVCILILAVKQSAYFLTCIRPSCVPCLAVPRFPALPHKHQDFRKKCFKYKISVLIFCTISFLNISHFKKNSTRLYHKCVLSSYNVSSILAGFNYILILSPNFLKIHK